MFKIRILALASAGFFVVSPTAYAQFADSVVSYNAGSGISADYQNPNVALGGPTLIADNFSGAVTPFNAPWQGGDIVGLGTNGSLTLEFSHPIENDPSHPYGLDFIIFGHAGFTDNDYPNGLSDGSLYTGGSANVRVSVSADGSTFYALNSLYTPLVDGLFPTDSAGNPLKAVNPALTAADFNGQNLAGIRSLYNGSAGGAGFDLDWAIDNSDQPVSLSSISYVRLDDLDGVAFIDAVSVVPEPATWSLGLLAGAGLLFRETPRQHLINVRWFPLILGAMVAVAKLGAATITENFATDPLQDGWSVFGNTNLFTWDAASRDLVVTWDSTQPNSYFYQKLGTILARDDDFTLAFDINLTNATADGFGFEMAVGFLNFQSATNTAFLRGTGHNSPNVAEWDYFPAASFQATVYPFIISTNSNKYLSGGATFPLTLTPGDWFHVQMAFTASNQTLHTEMTDNGVPIGPLNDGTLKTNFTDFRVDMISITSYDGTGSMGSLQAQGVISNLVVTVPPPPVQNLTGAFSNSVWQMQFSNRTNWLYTLQRTPDLLTWTNLTSPTPGIVGTLTLADTNPLPNQSFYRIQAVRP